MSQNWQLFDRAELLDQVSQVRRDGQREMLLRVEGLRCGACVKRLNVALPEGVFDARPDVPSGSCELSWDPQQVALSQILASIDDAGFTPVVVADDSDYQRVREERRSALARIGVALLFGMQVMMLASGEYLGDVDATMRPLLRYAQWLLATPVALYAGWPFLRDGWRSLLARAPTMDTPVAMALTGAYVSSVYNTIADTGHVYFDSVAMFVLLLSLARFWEQRGRAQAADRLRRLAATQPLSARRVDENGVQDVAAAELVEGDEILVAPGASVAADGVLLDTATEFDESLLTGEAVPQSRAVGDNVCAGSVNCGLHPVRIRVERCGAQTTLSQISRMVHRALAARPQVQIWADRIAGRFVAVVIALAAVALLWWWPDRERGFEAALAVLVVTCPCALSLATPMALASAMTRLSRQGLLMVRADALIKLASVDRVCIDKTGTLTTREMRVQRVRLLAEVNEADALAAAAALEAGLDHPIARAFRAFDQQDLQASEVVIEPGRGVSGLIEGRSWALRAEDPQSAGQDHTEAFMRWFVLGCEGQPVAHIALTEELREGVRNAVRHWHQNGLRVHLLSGDRPKAAAAVASFVGIDDVHSAMTPASKLAYLQSLQSQGHRVLAIGDGVNDGPLLAGADVSVGIASGAALAQAHGDAILMNDDLGSLSSLITTARRTRRVVTQNLVWAAAYNLTMLPLAFSGVITPWIAALGMGGSSLLVTLNAMRLLRGDAPQAAAQATLKRAVA